MGLVLASQVATEAECRTVVGRLYYGLHHEACCRYFRENPNGTPLSRNGRHTELHRRFNAPSNARSQLVGRQLNRLRIMRNKADYELGNLSYGSRTLTPVQFMDLALQCGRRLFKHWRHTHPEKLLMAATAQFNRLRNCRSTLPNLKGRRDLNSPPPKVSPVFPPYSHLFHPHETHMRQPSWKMTGVLHSGHLRAVGRAPLPFTPLPLPFPLPFPL